MGMYIGDLAGSGPAAVGSGHGGGGGGDGTGNGGADVFGLGHDLGSVLPSSRGSHHDGYAGRGSHHGGYRGRGSYHGGFGARGSGRGRGSERRGSLLLSLFS